MLIKSFVTIIVMLTSCWADENLYSNENESLVKLYMRKIKISDFKVPQIDSEEYIRELRGNLLRHQPPFDFAGHSVSKECRKSSAEFIKALEKFDLWALRMYDANAKISSGILSGNVNQYGDFDQCLDVSPTSNFKSQYCLAHIQPKVHSDYRYLNYLRTISLSFESYKSELWHPNHVMPKTSQILWGLCIPSTCTHKEVEFVLNEKLKSFFNNSDIAFETQVRENMCQTKVDQQPMEFGSKVAIGFVVLVLIVAVLASIYESKVDPPQQNEWLTAFSLKKNFADLISVKQPQGDIPTPHGIRFLNTVMLIISHKCMEIDFSPMTNKIDMSMESRSPTTVFVRASYLYTESFIMLSSMLVAYSFVGRLQRGQKINVLKEIAARYFRVVPPMAALMLFGTFILPLLSNGPQWNMLITDQSQLCKQTWWRNFLMIHNWFGFENICMTHTHHVGTDFGLFLSAPCIVTALYKYPRKSSLVIFVLAVISTIARFYVTYTRGLRIYVMFGTDVQLMYDASTFMYILPPYRFTIYAIGIALGYVLRTHKQVRLTEAQRWLGWVLTTVGMIGTVFLASLMSIYNYQFNATHAALYAAIAPVFWCFFFAWTIYTAQLGYKNKFVNFLEWRGFIVSTKLSYGIYLMQFAVFHFNLGKSRAPFHFGMIKSILNTNEFLWIIFASAILTLFFDYPFSNLKKLIFDSKRAETKIKVDTEPNRIEPEVKKAQ